MQALDQLCKEILRQDEILLSCATPDLAWLPASLQLRRHSLDQIPALLQSTAQLPAQAVESLHRIRENTQALYDLVSACRARLLQQSQCEEQELRRLQRSLQGDAESLPVHLIDRLV